MQNILLIDDDPNQHELFSFYLDETFGADCPSIPPTISTRLWACFEDSHSTLSFWTTGSVRTTATETIGAITDLSNDCQIYLISAARECEKLGDFRAHGIIDAIDKFELRQAIADGLLQPASRQVQRQARR